MSRLAKKPLVIPSGVTVEIDSGLIKVIGPLGSDVNTLPPAISLTKDGDKIWIERSFDDGKTKALQGLVWALVKNSIIGVSTGFSKRLLISGVGYRATKDGDNLILQIGYIKPVVYSPPEGINIVVESPDKVLVSGVSKELVGLVASQIRAVRPVEPYKGKGIRYEGEIVRRKAGKAVGKAKA